MNILEKEREYLQKLQTCETAALEKLVQKIEKILEDRKPIFKVGDKFVEKIGNNGCTKVWTIVGVEIGRGKSSKENKYNFTASHDASLTWDEGGLLHAIQHGTITLHKGEKE